MMLLNKGDNPLACDLSVQGVSLTSDAEHWSYGPQTPQAIVRQPDVKAAAFARGVTLRPKLQATSIHLLVLR